MPALITFAIIPFGDRVKIFGYNVDLVITDINVGFLYIFAVSSLGIYGIVMAGWASNNKYSLLGGIRATAQMISYELPLGLSLIGVVMLTESLSLVDVVNGPAKTVEYFIATHWVFYLWHQRFCRGQSLSV